MGGGPVSAHPLIEKPKINMLRLDHKIAVVPGGGSGIGKAISLLFAKQGATVCVLDVDEQGGETTANEIWVQQGQALFKKCNIADIEEVKQVVEDIVERYTTIDILVNNAVVSHIGTVETTTAEEFDKLLNVNVKG